MFLLAPKIATSIVLTYLSFYSGALSGNRFEAKVSKRSLFQGRSIFFASFLLFLALYVESRRTSRTPFEMSTEKLASQLLISKELVIAFLSILIWDFVRTSLSSSALLHIRNRDTDESLFGRLRIVGDSTIRDSIYLESSMDPTQDHLPHQVSLHSLYARRRIRGILMSSPNSRYGSLTAQVFAAIMLLSSVPLSESLLLSSLNPMPVG